MSALLDASAQKGSIDAWFAFVQAVTVLTAVVALAWLVWKARQQAATLKATPNLRVEARLALDLKNTLWIVNVEGRRVLLGTAAEGAPPRLLLELPPAPALSEAIP